MLGELKIQLKKNVIIRLFSINWLLVAICFKKDSVSVSLYWKVNNKRSRCQSNMQEEDNLGTSA